MAAFNQEKGPSQWLWKPMDRWQHNTTTTGLHNEADTRTPAPVTTRAALMMWCGPVPVAHVQTYPSYCGPEWLHWPEIWQSPQLNCSLPRPAQVGRCQCNVYHCIRPSRAFLIIWLGSESLLSAGHSGQWTHWGGVLTNFVKVQDNWVFLETVKLNNKNK